MRRRRQDEAGRAELVALAALADGSLAPERRAALDARVAASSELAKRLAEQQRAVTLARSATSVVEALAAPRESIELAPVRSTASATTTASRTATAEPTSDSAPPRRLAARTVQQGERFPRGSCTHRPRARRRRRGDAHQDSLGLADRTRCHGTSAPPRRAFYEAWLRSPAGALEPIGTFKEGRKALLWAGVSPKDYPSLTVTREQADGDQASSGEKVLFGTANPGG
jgi:hypothetical protein